ncbi:hypothetical protein [Brevibacillus borstelensis]|uniref:hypothetical protein n=1 Tax=Brevibacillus borstelensis TaxID=45462 RepID=UPI0030C3792A
MKRSESFDDVKQLITDTPVPRIDIKDQVLDRLRERQNKKEEFRVKKRMGLIIAACVVFSVTSAYAAVKVYELKNEQGEVVSKITQTTEDPVVGDHKTYSELLEEVRASIKPGKAAAVYIVPDNPNKIVSFLQTPLISTDQAVIQGEVGDKFTFPAELAGGYAFKEGTVLHEIIRDYKKEDFYKEAEETKKEVIVKELKVQPNIDNVIATYTHDKREVSLIIKNFENVKYASTEAGPDDTVEKVKVGAQEALYTLNKIKGADGNVEKIHQTVEFYKEDKKLMINVFTTSPDMTKKDLLAIAEKLVK